MVLRLYPTAGESGEWNYTAFALRADLFTGAPLQGIVLQLLQSVDKSGYMDKNSAIGTLSALAHGGRLDAFRLLLAAAPGELAAGEISTRLKTVQNTMSTHLAILERTGLISSRRAGRNVLYRAEPGAMRDLLAWLMEDCCQGDPEICQPLMAVLTCNDC